MSNLGKTVCKLKLIKCYSKKKMAGLCNWTGIQNILCLYGLVNFVSIICSSEMFLRFSWNASKRLSVLVKIGLLLLNYLFLACLIHYCCIGGDCLTGANLHVDVHKRATCVFSLISFWLTWPQFDRYLQVNFSVTKRLHSKRKLFQYHVLVEAIQRWKH